MEKVRTIVVDDDSMAVNMLSDILNEIDAIEIVTVCHSASEAIKVIRQEEPDLIFLDIVMPKMDGFQLLQELDPVDFEVIFTTSHDDYAVKAFEVNAIDYLVKPLDHKSVRKSILKVLHRRSGKLQMRRMEAMLNQVINQNGNRQSDEQQKIALNTGDGIRFFKYADIIRCRAEGNYAHVYFTNGESLLLTKTLKELEEMFTHSSFFRIHSSHLININHISKYMKSDGGYVVMADSETITLARNRKEEFLKLFPILK